MTDQAIQTTTDKTEALAKAGADIEQIVKECGIFTLRNQPVFVQTITLAKGIKSLQSVLTKGVVEAYFLPLQNTSLGFLTDKPEGYSWEVVRDCVIEAMLRGFRPIGNEMNLISGRFYGAKNGFERVVREYPGLSNLEFDLAVPVLAGDKGALVAFRARWALDGDVMDLVGMAPGDGQIMDTRIPVKVNSGMGPDAILGKATRKMFFRIYNRITGVQVLDAEGEEMPAKNLPAPATPAQDGQRIALGAKKNATAPATTEAPEPGSNG